MSIARIGVFAAVCAAAALLACISAELADAQSSVAAAAVHKCSIITASHRNQGQRALSSAQVKKGQRLCSQARTYINGIRYWQNPKRRWTLYPNQNDKKCWQVHLRGPLSRCLAARGAVRRNTIHLVRVDHKLTKLLPKPHLVHDWLFNALMCIHRQEGSWNDRRNPKYNGGMQMDAYFEATYGADFVVKYGGYIATDSGGHKYAVGGHAYLWKPYEQLEAAKRAYYSGRGFSPWPYTAVACGYSTAAVASRSV